MNVTRLKQRQDAFVRLRLPKGVLVVLTVNEYTTALYRGKMERRAQRRARHAQQHGARRDAAALAWITQGDHTMSTVMGVPQQPASPALVHEPDPHDDIADPAVPEALGDALQAPPPPDWQQHEALLQGFLTRLQARLHAWIEDEHKALQSARATCDLEHQRLCQSLETVAKLAQHAVTTSQQTNEHAQYSLTDAFARLQDHGVSVRLHPDPYEVRVRGTSPHGYPIEIRVAKADVTELIGALPALTGWLAQEGYKPQID